MNAYTQYAIERAIINLAPLDKSAPDIDNALSWLRSTLKQEPELLPTAEELDALLADAPESSLRSQASSCPMSTRADNTKGPVGIPFGPHFTCSQCGSKVFDNIVTDQNDNVWCQTCQEAEEERQLVNQAVSAADRICTQGCKAMADAALKVLGTGWKAGAHITERDSYGPVAAQLVLTSPKGKSTTHNI